MKVIVLGAGVVGVSTAYYLAKQGHQVVVIEKSSNSASGCSFANGGQLSYSHIETWSNKSFVKAMLKGVVLNSSFVKINDYSNLDFYKWIYNFLKNSTAENSLKNSKKLHKLTTLSQKLMNKILLDELAFKNGEVFDYQQKGSLHFYRLKKNLNSAISRLDELKNLHLNYQILTPDECLTIEPSLHELQNNNKLAGGIFFKNDASGDCHKFTANLEEICKEKYGVEFIFDCEIKNILTNFKKITGINTSNGVMVADKYVYAMGAISTKLLSGIGIDTNIYPIRGYSLTLNNNKLLFSNLAITDNENKMVYSRLGKSIRVAGLAEMNGANSENSSRNINFLYNAILKTFALDIDKTKIKEWHGIRPFRPNSIPLIGQIEQLSNFYLNTGHGSLGWTNSLASGKIIAHKISAEAYSDFAESEFEQFNFLNDEFKNIFKNPR
jgi:D-amino-acid dehydrogenase